MGALKTNVESILIDVNRFINIDNDRQRYANHMIALKNIIFKKLEDDDVMKYLLNGHRFVGSYGDNLKVYLPDEYDMNFYIKFPERSLIIVKEDRSLPGNVHLDFTKVLAKIEKEKQHQKILKFIKKWLDEKNYLKVEKFQAFINSLFTNIMLQMQNHVKIDGKPATLRYSRQGPAHTIHVKESLNIEYSVDFVPGILLNEDQNIISNVAGPWEAIPKPSYVPDTNYTSFRASYYRQEQKLINNKNDLKNVLRMIKKFRDSHLNMKKLKSYFIKTHFLWKAKQENDNYWRKSLTVITIDMFKAMEKSLKDENLPYFWDKRLNLYERFEPRLLREMLTCVEKSRETLEKAAQKLTPALQRRVYQIFLSAHEREMLNSPTPEKSPASWIKKTANNNDVDPDLLPPNKQDTTEQQGWKCTIS